MSQRVVLAGASGLIGSALASSLREDGTEVVTLVRRPAASVGEVSWNPGERLDPEVLAGASAVVGLNGASIGRFPWTRRYRAVLTSSRLEPTRTLATAVRELGSDAPAFVSASAVGWYGSAPGVRLTESSPAGAGFLADLSARWEAVARGAGAHTRIALLRTAPVVHAEGVLKPLLTLTRLGVSGPIGRGNQSWPWISLADEVAAIKHIINGTIDGPVNLTGPTRATANDLGFALAVRMNRPFIVPAPAWALRLVLGRDATDSLLTVDANVAPVALLESGFEFTHSTVESAVDSAVTDLEEARAARRSRA